MTDALELSDRLWRGDAGIEDHHPVTSMTNQLTEVAPRTAFVASFANVSAFSTDDGLFLVDTGSKMLAPTVHNALRGWSPDRVNTAIYSHGHIDHVFGVPVFEEEAKAKGWPAPRVIAHEAMPARFDRYILTAGYNSIVNQRQFQAPRLQWPTDYRYPDETYRDIFAVEVGGETFELHHALGETDDHTWTWIPQRKTVCTGDFFIWASPNAGNPQKVQRYPREWAVAMRDMAALEPELLLPGHGLPIAGKDRVRQALVDVADLLDSLVDQTLALMNEGARLDDIIHTVRAPSDLLERPYLRPIYDEPEFVVRNVWRLYGGWYDGNPANLKPAPDGAVAREVASLAGGAARVAERALAVAEQGDLRLASHLAEMAVLADPGSPEVHRARAHVFGRRAEAEASVMSRGIFRWAASESEKKTNSD